MNKAIISIRKLSLHHHHHFLFHQLDFDLPIAKWSCLLGKSGCGKSTLLRIIAGLPTGCQKTSGHVHILDNKLQTGCVAYMAQQDCLLPWLSVLNNVLISHRLKQKRISAKLKHQALTLLEQVGLAAVCKLTPDKLSGGMRQRAALVRILLEKKPIVLMDEPFSALDVLTRFKLQSIAAKLLKNCTVLLVTHDPLEALRLGNYIYILSGTPAKLSQAPPLQGEPPHDLSDPLLLTKQTKLLALLAKQTNNDTTI